MSTSSSSTSLRDLKTSAVRDIERQMSLFFERNVDSSGSFMPGMLERYHDEFIQSSHKIDQRRLKDIVMNNFHHLNGNKRKAKEKIVKVTRKKKKAKEKVVDYTKKKGNVKEEILKYLYHYVRRTSGRLRREATTSASEEYNIPLAEVKRIWRSHRVALRRNSKNTKKDAPLTGTEGGVSSACESQVTQEDDTAGRCG